MDSLVKIDGKSVEKLIDVVSSAIGTLYRPRAIRKEADARAYEIKAIAKAKAEAVGEGRLIEVENLNRVEERLIAKELKRQNNIDDVVEVAANQLKSEEIITDEKVDEDWATRFFNIVEDVSKDEMKNLWGRILAGEIKQPKSYSLRTLELLHNLSKEEAELFMMVSRYAVLSFGNESESCLYKGLNNILDKYGVSYTKIARLVEAGLLQPGSLVSRTFKKNVIDHEYMLKYCNILLLINVKANTPEFSMPIILFTNAGNELLSLMESEPSLEYISDIAESIKKEGVSMQYGYINYVSNNQVNYKEPLVDL